MSSIRSAFAVRSGAILILILAVSGLTLPPGPARADSDSQVVVNAMNNMISTADANIRSLERALSNLWGGIPRKLADKINQAETEDEAAEVVEERIEDLTGGIPIPWDTMAPGLKDLHRLAAVYRALETWQQLRRAWRGVIYYIYTGKEYKTSYLPGGNVCEEDRFAYSTVPPSTLYTSSASPLLDIRQASNLGIQLNQLQTQVAKLTDIYGRIPGEEGAPDMGTMLETQVAQLQTQIAVLTDVQGTPAGAKGAPDVSKTFNLANMQNTQGSAMGGGQVEFTVGVPLSARAGQTESQPSALSERDSYVGLNPGWRPTKEWAANLELRYESGSEIPDDKVTAGYYPCPPHSTLSTQANLIDAAPTAAFIFGGGIAKVKGQCQRRQDLSLGEDPGVVTVMKNYLRGGFICGPTAAQQRDGLMQWDGQFRANGIEPSYEEDDVDLWYLSGANITFAYCLTEFANYELTGAQCARDLVDINFQDGYELAQTRYIAPVAQSKVDGATQLAEVAPESVAQVAAKQEGAFPNDFYFHSKGSLKKGVDDQWALKRIGFSPVKRGAKGSLWPDRATPVLVAVVDTGVDASHPELAGALFANPGEVPGNGKDDDKNGYIDDVFGWNFIDNSNNIWDSSGHGTFVAGIIAARTDDALGIAGVNPWARILPVKVSDFNGEGDHLHVTAGIHYAVKMGARVINVSIGGRKLTIGEKYAIDYAVKEGALVVVAAGNDAADVSDYSPAGIPGVITVASTGYNDERMGFSNYGAAVDIAAPGVDILSLRARQTDLLQFADKAYKPESNFVGDTGLFYRLSGTSFSAPFVAGVASLLFSINPELKPEQVKRMILQSARDIDAPGFDWFTGYGLLDAKAALAADPEYYVIARIADVNLVQQDNQNFLMATGSASANQLKRAWIEVGKGKNPQSWTKATGDLAKGVDQGPVGLVPVDLFTAGGDWTLRLVVEHANGSRREARYELALQ